MFKGSWKTTIGGIAGLLGIVAKVTNEGTVTVEDIAIFGTSLGLIFARDNNKTSEDVQAK